MKYKHIHQNTSRSNIASPDQTASPRKTRIACGLSLAVIGLSAPLASAATIVVQNGSFETTGALIGGPWARMQTSTWNPSFTGDSNFQQTNDNARFTTRTDAGIWYGNLTDPSTTIGQNLSTIVNSGDTLEVTFHIGRAISEVGGVMSATFLVAGTPYTETFDTTGLTQNTWQSYTLTKTIANSGALSLQFGNVSGRPWLDNIGNVTVIPEPSSLALAGLGMVSLLGFRRRRAGA